MTQNQEHLLNVSNLASKYLTPGGPDDTGVDVDQDDEKNNSPNPPDLNRQVTQYLFSKHTPTQLKELVERVFEDHFDVNKENECDITEFKNALQNLGFALNESRTEKLFRLISSNDGEADSGYIDKVNFSDFILGQYYNDPTLQTYQEELLRAISPKFVHSHTDAEQADDGEDDMAEMAAMQRQLNMMIENELHITETEAVFQEELLKRKTEVSDGHKFCDEHNAEHWDRYEVAYWVGNIVGFTYAMKRFYDEHINGSMLLYDINDQVLRQKLTIKELHLNTFKRKLESLRAVALKELYDAERKKKQEMQEEKERELKAKEERLHNPYGNKNLLMLDMETADQMHIESETQLEAEKQQLAKQALELQAEREYISKINELNKQLLSVTNEKSSLMLKMSELTVSYEKQMNELKQQLHAANQVKHSSATTSSKEVDNLKSKLALEQQKNLHLSEQNEELQAKLLQIEREYETLRKQEKPESVLKLDIERLESQLRTKDNRVHLLESKLQKYKSVSVELLEDYDGAQVDESPSQNNHEKKPKLVTEPRSQSKRKHSSSSHGAHHQKQVQNFRKPGQFLAVHPSSTSVHTTKGKKSSMDSSDGSEENDDDEMMIYDSDNTPQ